MGQIPTIALKIREEILKIDVKYSSRKNLIKYGDVIIDNKAKRAFCCDNEMHMTPKEYKILEFLANHPGEVFSEKLSLLYGQRVPALALELLMSM